MRISCNGCRVLRKGCSDSCSIRPCLQWIPSPQSQANATVFLAKFYGRAGLINLINAGPENLRPEIFKSLLYEACGRMVDPINGLVGLMISGKWLQCQAAVEAVLSGAPIAQVPSQSVLSGFSPPFKGCDIRHVSRHKNSDGVSDRLHKVASKTQFKRSAPKPKSKVKPENSGSPDSGLSQCDGESVQTVEASLVKADEAADGSEVELELSLGFKSSWWKAGSSINGCNGADC
ncbi:hypothetical protein SLEP1_g33259 [Rubroshorea leprosula]|uniref:LOB domain-containing protein n=1 Tax=Rubroshorea leprosula TaxID=152421 RepID=A0AAV5KG89_9ROSI|nr:hypothetical protein SLEP1_g33259 [Rubroshorea leprosula]